MDRKQGLRVFEKTVGEPAWVVFHVSIWDIFHVDKAAVTGDHPFVAQYKGQLVARLADVDRCKPANTRVALRTGPHMAWGGNAQVCSSYSKSYITRHALVPFLPT